jgi:hypothetical protein
VGGGSSVTSAAAGCADGRPHVGQRGAVRACRDERDHLAD